MTDFYSYKIPELKQYLHERGFICSLGLKLDLIRLYVNLARSLHLEIIPADDGWDYKLWIRKNERFNTMTTVLKYHPPLR